MTMIEEAYRASDRDPVDAIGAEAPDLDTGQIGIVSSTGKTQRQEAEKIEERERVQEAAGAIGDDTDSPSCLFYSCFACEKLHCTILRDNDFHGKPCSFFKTRADALKQRQEAFDRILMNGRLDLINRYEEILISLGIEDPEDAKIPVDDDILAARQDLEDFLEKLKQAEAGKTEEDVNSDETDSDEYDLGDLMNGADEAKDNRFQ